MEMPEIRQKVKMEQLEWQGKIWVDAATWHKTGGRAIRVDAGGSAGTVFESAEQDGRLVQDEEDKEIDYSMDEEGVIKTGQGAERRGICWMGLHWTEHHQWGSR